MDAELRAALEGRLGPIEAASPLAGGDINSACRVSLRGGACYFVKANRCAPSDLFTREAEGLSWIAETGALRVPRVIECSVEPPHFLVLEFLESAPRARNFEAQLGAGLAMLHAASAASWGALRDNYIGLLTQSNDSAPSWSEFYVTRRLQPQLRRACDVRRGQASWSARFDALFKRLPQLLVTEPPQRLHGDLWAGNVLSGPKGEPCLIDPAAYAGHREVDLAMMRLFGGFPEQVFAAYEAAFPTLPGAAERIPLYQLYPLLVHLNLFGEQYASGVERCLDALGV